MQHTRMFYYPILAIASQSSALLPCKKVVDITSQSKERVNKLSNCHFFAPILKG